MLSMKVGWIFIIRDLYYSLALFIILFDATVVLDIDSNKLSPDKRDP